MELLRHMPPEFTHRCSSVIPCADEIGSRTRRGQQAPPEASIASSIEQ